MSQRRLPAEIYWRRRLFLLAGLIAIVWIAFQLIGGGDDKPSSKPAPTTSATPTVAPTVEAPVNGVVQVSLVSASKPCDPEKIRITPSVEAGQLTKAPVEIGMVVSSSETAACTLSPDDADMVAVISANKTAIWDSTVCKASLIADEVAISPKWGSLVTGTWSGRGSGSRCSPKDGYATPGTYTVQVGTLGGEPGKTSFTIKAKPTPKTTKTKPKSSKGTPKPPKGTTKPADE